LSSFVVVQAPAAAGGAKRGRAAADDGGAGAGAGAAAGAGVVAAMDWKKLAEAGADKLSSFTIPVLKEGLASLGLRVSGKKSDLVDRLLEHFQQ
jgi:hypothetical protein